MLLKARNGKRPQTKQMDVQPFAFPFTFVQASPAEATGVLQAVKMSLHGRESAGSTTTRYTIASSSTSRYTTASRTKSDPNVYPDANVIHHYTHCQHTSPPKNRPLNVQPALIHSSSAGGAPTSTLLGRCYNCDVEYRRQQETSVLQKYHRISHTLHLRLIAAREGLQTVDTHSQVDEDGIDQIVKDTEELVAKREADVQIVWRGFSKRWGPGAVGVQPGVNGGRMNLKWERPEK